MVIYYFLFHKDKFVSFTPDYCNIFSSIKNKDKERERESIEYRHKFHTQENY